MPDLTGETAGMRHFWPEDRRFSSSLSRTRPTTCSAFWEEAFSPAREPVSRSSVGTRGLAWMRASFSASRV